MDLALRYDWSGRKDFLCRAFMEIYTRLFTRDLSLSIGGYLPSLSWTISFLFFIRLLRIRLSSRADIYDHGRARMDMTASMRILCRFS